MSKINWKITLLSVWSIAALLYILFDIYNDIKINLIQASYQQWKTEAVAEIINQTTSKCEPINIFVGNKKADIIDINCLQKLAAQWTWSTK